MFMNIFGYVEVESRIVHEYDTVRLPLLNLLLALAHTSQYLGQMEHNGQDTHICQLPVVHEEILAPTLFSHKVAAVEVELSLRITGFNGLHEVGSMQVATGFSGYDKILHDD